MDARRLARQDPFEFEKWVCGRIGANGLGKRLGARGADQGIDGIIELATIRDGRVIQETAIVQVKGGRGHAGQRSGRLAKSCGAPALSRASWCASRTSWARWRINEAEKCGRMPRAVTP